MGFTGIARIVDMSRLFRKRDVPAEAPPEDSGVAVFRLEFRASIRMLTHPVGIAISCDQKTGCVVDVCWTIKGVEIATDKDTRTSVREWAVFMNHEHNKMTHRDSEGSDNPDAVASFDWYDPKTAHDRAAEYLKNPPGVGTMARWGDENVMDLSETRYPSLVSYTRKIEKALHDAFREFFEYRRRGDHDDKTVLENATEWLPKTVKLCDGLDVLEGLRIPHGLFPDPSCVPSNTYDRLSELRVVGDSGNAVFRTETPDFPFATTPDQMRPYTEDVAP